MMRARTIIAGGAIGLAAGSLAIATFLWGQQPARVAAPASRPVATAEIARGPLRDTKTVTGTLGYGELSSLRPALAAPSAMVTWIAPVGSVVERGAPLYRLDGQPTVLFYGPVPQYRTLRFDPHASAPVWVELEEAEASVKSAALALQLEQLRLAAAQTRIDDATARLADAAAPVPASSEFVQLAGAVRAAEAKVDRIRTLSAAQLTPTVDLVAADAELATARASLDAAIQLVRKDIADSELDAATARVAIAEREAKLEELRTTRDELRARAADDTDVRQIADNLTALGYSGPLADQVRRWQRDAGLAVTGIIGPSQVVVIPGPVHVAAHGAAIGETLVASSPDRGSILDYSSIDKLVTVPLSVGDQRLAAPERSVVVTLPDDSKVNGVISKVGSVVTNGTFEITVGVADQAALGGLEVASVDVELVSDSRSDVLSVPITALLARPEGGFAVEVITQDAAALVPVNTGLFAAGRVEIAGDGIAEGMRVGVPG